MLQHERTLRMLLREISQAHKRHILYGFTHVRYLSQTQRQDVEWWLQGLEKGEWEVVQRA